MVSNQLSSGHYKNASEVARAGRRILEEEEIKVNALKSAIQKGDDSPRAEGFDFKENL